MELIVQGRNIDCLISRTICHYKENRKLTALHLGAVGEAMPVVLFTRISDLGIHFKQSVINSRYFQNINSA